MMKKPSADKPRPRLSHDAYAGFLRLWLTRASSIPAACPEVDAYLAFANRREPLPAPARRALARPIDEAA
jgi:hypothetical protein